MAADPHSRRRARRQAVVRRRRIAGSILVALLTVAFTLTLRAVLRSSWPELPFPQRDGLLTVAAVSFGFGLLIRRWWSIFLCLGIVPLAAHTSGGGLAGGAIGLLVAGPYAVVGFGGGVAVSRALVRPERLRAAVSPTPSARPRRAPARPA
jgi:hypothetical protein